MTDETEAGVAAIAVTETLQLNVGGTVYETALSTLLRHPNSFFGALVRNRGASTRLFIDRDPTYFRHVLNFMRSGYVTTPSDDDAKRELLLEAEFYGLASLARGIRAPELDLSRHLEAAVLAEREQESLVRDIYATNDALRISRLSPNEALINFFGSFPRGVSFATAPPCDASSTLLFDLMQPTAPLGREGSPATIASIDVFKSNFNALFPGVLARLEAIIDQDGIFIAGGSALLALTADAPRAPPRDEQERWAARNAPRPTKHTGDWGECGDVDIFIPACNAEKATEIAERIWTALAVDGEFWKIERTGGVVNLSRYDNKRQAHCGVPNLIVQLVLRQYASPAEVLLCFDVDCCAVAYGTAGPKTPVAVWASPRAVRAIQTGRNIVNALHAWPRCSAYEIRLCKYACRGFSVFCPGLDPRRVDHARIRGADFNDLVGAASLLRLASVLEPLKPRNFAEAKKFMILNVFKSEAGLRFHLPGSGIERERLRVLPGDEPVNLNYSSTVQGQLATATDEEAASLRGWKPNDLAWTMLTSEDHWMSAAVRTSYWNGMADAGHNHLEIPRRLVDAWHTQRDRRAAYINASDPDHAAVYYAHAYTEA